MSILDRIEALEHAIEQMNTRGTIEEVDCSTRRVRVRYGPDSVSDWVEWKPMRSGLVTIWSPPQVGEGVTLLNNGDINQSEALLGSYHSSMPAPSDDPEETVIEWPDGTVIRYHMGTHKLTLDVSGDVEAIIKGNVNAKASGSVVVESDGDASVSAKGRAKIEAGGACELVAKASVLLKGLGITMQGGGSGSMSCGGGGIQLGSGGGSGVVTGASICAYTGKPHGDCSTTVTATK
ncbi:MAG: phage baseplate assembly protein V [Aeromonas veronii]